MSGIVVRKFGAQRFFFYFFPVVERIGVFTCRGVGSVEKSCIDQVAQVWVDDVHH